MLQTLAVPHYDATVDDAFPGARVSVHALDGRETTMQRAGLLRPLKAVELSAARCATCFGPQHSCRRGRPHSASSTSRRRACIPTCCRHWGG